MHFTTEFMIVFCTSVMLLLGVFTKKFCERVSFPYTVAMLLVGMLTGFLLLNIEETGMFLGLFHVAHHGFASHFFSSRRWNDYFP